MEEKELSEQESLLIIQQMIQTAKKEQEDDGRGWILWGWMLFASSVLTVFNMQLKWFNPYFFWNAFGVITIIYFLYEIVTNFFIKKKEKVKTYTQDLFNKLNIGFFISLMFVILCINIPVYQPGSNTPTHAVSPMIGFPLLINAYAFWILIYGTALNFKPSVIGAYITWTFGIGALFVKTFEIVMIMHALAVLSGYIIPGHLAYREFKKLHRQEKEKSV